MVGCEHKTRLGSDLAKKKKQAVLKDLRSVNGILQKVREKVSKVKRCLENEESWKITQEHLRPGKVNKWYNYKVKGKIQKKKPRRRRMTNINCVFGMNLGIM